MKKAVNPMMLITTAFPLIQGLINKNPLKAFSSDKIKFTCVSQIKGRRRYKSALLKQEKFATALKSKIDSFKLLRKLTINTVTGSMLLEYSCTENKIDEMMNALNEQSKKLSENASRTEKNVQRKGQGRGQRLTKTAMSATAAIAGGKGAAALGKGIGRGIGMKGGKATSILPSLLSTINISGLSGIVATACLAWGGYKLITKNQIPVGPQIVWFGYKAIEGLIKR